MTSKLDNKDRLIIGLEKENSLKDKIIEHQTSMIELLQKQIELLEEQLIENNNEEV